MKIRSVLRNYISCLAVLMFLVALTGCSMSSMNWSHLKFWQAKKQSAAMDEKAVMKFMDTIRSRPGNPDSHYILATYYQERGRYREAISEFDKVLFMDPSHIKAYNGRGISLDQLGEHVLARESFERAIAINPKVDYVWNNLCYSLVMQRKYAEAIESCQKALALNEKSNRIRNNLALAYAMAGQYDQALKEFELASNGSKSYAHLKLADIYLDKGMFQKSLEQYQLASNLDPASEKAMKGMNAAQQLIKVADTARKNSMVEASVPERTEETAGLSKKSDFIPIDPVKAREQSAVARKLYEKGSFEQAKKHFEKAMIFDPALISAQRGFEAAKALAKINQIDSSTKKITRVANVVTKKDKDFLGRIGIEIINGNGKRHMARNMGKYLKTRGFNVVRLTNADSFQYAKGRIIYEREYRQLALKILDKIPQITEMQEIAKSGRQNIKVRVLLGRDLISTRQS